MTEQFTFTEHNGIVLESVTTEQAIAYLDITTAAHNIYGFVHGGLLYALGDTTAGMLARSEGHSYVTLDGTMNYFKNVANGRIHATATALHRGRTTCVVQITILSGENQLLAQGTYTMFRIQK